MSLREWWESRPAIQKHHIIDYKFTDFNWDNLNETDKAIIAFYYDSLRPSKKGDDNDE